MLKPTDRALLSLNFNRAPVVIIGAGVAGLTAANLLARNGFNVTIFEAGNKIGGCCATTTLDGYTFNDGAVYLAVTDVLDHVFAKAGLDRVELLPLRKITANFSAVISTASGMLTFSSLIEAEQAPAAVVRTLKRLRLSHKAVSIQFGLLNKIEAPAHSVKVLPWMEYQHEIFMQDGREMKFPVYLVPTVTMPELAPRGGGIVELFYPVRSDLPLEYWDEERKSQITKAAIDALSRSHKLSIAVTRVRSPKDFWESMHLFQGALYGLSPAVTPLEQFPHTPPIPGLFLAGQTTFPRYGAGAAMMSSIFAAEALSTMA